MKDLVDWSSAVNNNTDTKYIDYLNVAIPGDAFKIKRDSKTLEDKLSVYGYAAIKKLKLLNRKGSSSQREKFLNSFKVISLLKEEVISVEEWQCELDKLKSNLDLVDLELSDWKKKFHDNSLQRHDGNFLRPTTNHIQESIIA